jgi:hypothetical protein
MVFTAPDGAQVDIRVWLPDGLTTEVVEGIMDRKLGWVSSGFGQRGPAPAVISEGSAELPVTLVTAVVPRGNATQIEVSCEVAPDGPGARVDVAFTGGSDSVTIGPSQSAGVVFDGALGFTARRGEITERYGVEVVTWTEGGSAVRFEDVPNRLDVRHRRAEASP